MNGTEQKNHRTATQSLASNLTMVAEVSARRFDALDRRLEALDTGLRQKIGEETTHRLKLADEQRSYVDREDNELRFYAIRLKGELRDFQERGFWSRLNWLLTGR